MDETHDGFRSHRAMQIFAEAFGIRFTAFQAGTYDEDDEFKLDHRQLKQRPRIRFGDLVFAFQTVAYEQGSIFTE